LSHFFEHRDSLATLAHFRYVRHFH
jgi:hypothetical protein